MGHLALVRARPGRSPWPGNARAVAVLAAVAGGLGLGAPSADAASVGQVRVGPNYRLTTDPSPLRGKDAVGLAVDPANSRHIVEINSDVLTGQCEYNVSFDGGSTFRGGDLAAPAGYTLPCQVGGHLANELDAGVQFGSGQNVYVTFAAARINQLNQAEAKSVLVARSSNGGRSFGVGRLALRGGAQPPPRGAGPDYVLPKLAVEKKRGGDRVYVVAGSAEAGQDTGTTGEFTAVTVSNDGGKTFGPRSNANPPTENAIEQSQPVVGRNHTLYVAYRTRGRGNVQIGPLAKGPNPDGSVIVARSTDQGRTFRRSEAAKVRGYVYEGPNTPPFTNPNTSPNAFTEKSYTASTFPRLAIDNRSGRLYLVYGQGPPGPRQGSGDMQTASGRVHISDHFIDPGLHVYFQRSTNGGVSWSHPDLVDDTTTHPGTPIVQTRHPNISVAPDGRIDVLWQDRRHWYRGCTNTHVRCDEARLGDTYYAYSTDGGKTFSANHRITDRSMGNDIGFDYRFGTYWDYGPLSVPLGNGQILAAWMDSRLGNFVTDTQDIYFAKVNLHASGPAPVQRVSAKSPSDLSVRLSRLARPGGGEAVLASTFATRPFTRVVIVNDHDTAAALAGGVLGRGFVGPVLASPRDGLPAGVKAEVKRLRPVVGAYVIGDQRALSDRVLRQLAAAGVPRDQIKRLSGPGAAGNAKLIAEQLDRRSDQQRQQHQPAFDAAVIANPRSPESAAVSALAAARRLPVLYVNRESIPRSTRDALSELNIDRTLVIGGTASVSKAVERQLPSPKRLSGSSARSSAAATGGSDVFGTSRAVVAESRRRGLPDNLLFTTGGSDPFTAALTGSSIGRITGLLGLSPKPGAGSAGEFGLKRRVDRVVVVQGGAARPAAQPRFTG